MMTLSVVFLITVFGIALFFDQRNTQISEATGLVVNLDSFPVYIETHPIMNSLPKDASISLEIGEQTYGISGKNIDKDKILSDPHISIKLPKNYEIRIGEIGLCSAIGEAVKNGDLDIETHISNTKLLIKYYSLIKYKKCLDK